MEKRKKKRTIAILSVQNESRDSPIGSSTGAIMKSQACHAVKRDITIKVSKNSK